jgi:hypothetical protein
MDLDYISDDSLALNSSVSDGSVAMEAPLPELPAVQLNIADSSPAIERTIELYDKLADKIVGLKKKALANLVYEEDFDRDPSNLKRFRLCSADGSFKPFTSWIFGEVVRSSLGTVHQATGNHWAGKAPPVCVHCCFTFRSLTSM